MKEKINYSSPDELWGRAITYTRIDDDGKMWVGNDEYETQVNYCPFTGKLAPKQLKLYEEIISDTDSSIIKKYKND